MTKFYPGKRKLILRTRQLIPLLLVLLLAGYHANAGNYYLRNIDPWGSTQNQTCMDAVFGAGNWTQGTYSTPAATVFAPGIAFVMMEGSENNDTYLESYMLANQATIENWVNNGGRLFINAAPWYTNNQNWGFSGTTLVFDPNFVTSPAWDGTTNVPGNQIFIGPYTPTATYFNGSYFAHAYITGTGLTTLFYDPLNPSHSSLTYKTWGAGVVFFGGMTQPQFWTPSPQSINVWQNIFWYVANIPLQSITTTVPNSTYCAGANLNISYSSNGLTFTGTNTFTVQLSDAAGSFATPTAIGTLTSAATSGNINCTIPLAQGFGTGYRIRTVSDDPVFTGADNGTDLTINPALLPTITITASPGTSVCTGTNVTFTAATTNGGPNPVYAWYVNGNPVGSGSSYSTTTLNDGDVVTCQLTSNATCATPANVTSNSITMNITPPLTATITISATNNGNGCIGQPMDFTSSVANAGPTPSYQWMKNGNPIPGATNATYTDNGLNDGDVITCDMLSSNPCVPPAIVNSDTITVTINPVVVPTVTITADPGDNVCAGSPVTFTAEVTNGGTSPVYIWSRNNAVTGGNQNTYTGNFPISGNVVSCTVVSNATCAIPDTVTSNSMTITTFDATPYLSGTLGNSISKNQLITGYIKNDVRDVNCDLMVTIEPQWQNPVYGNTNVKVTIDPDVTTYNGQPYLQRHFDIEPANNAATSTAFVTLYAYQSEFDAYNAVADTLGLPLMPTDFVQTGNIRVTQFHGTGTEPGNYSAGTYTVINPAVSWDPVHQWWQLVFPVTGFSGFYIHTGNFPLNLKQVQPDDFSVIAYPNPVQDKVTVTVTGQRAANSMISVTDITGRTIMTVPMTNDKAIADISALAQGMYLIKYTDDARSQTLKITKE